MFSVEFSSCAHLSSSGAGQLKYIVVSLAYSNEPIGGREMVLQIGNVEIK